MENIYNDKHQFKKFFGLIKLSKVPWYLYIITFVMDLAASTLFVQLPILLGDIMQGKIFDKWLITKYGVLSLAQILLAILSMIVFSWVSMKVSKATTASVWKKSIRMKMVDLDKESPSTLISRTTNDSSYIDLAITGIFNILNVAYSTMLIYYNMFIMNRSLSYCLLLVFVWILLSMKIVGKKSYKAQSKIQDNYSIFTSYLAERIPNMRIVKAFSNEKHENKVGTEKIQEQYRADIYLVKVNAVSSFFQAIGTTISNSIVLIFGSYLVAKNQMHLGDFVTFFLFVNQGQFTFNAENLILYYQNIKMGMGGSSKIAEIINGQEEELPRDKSFTVPEADIEFKDVSFEYGGCKVLSNLSFSIPKGKVTAIIGPSGSGKTTILKLLERFYTPSSGKISYGSTNIEEFHLNEWRESMGYVVQNSPLMSGTIRDNIVYGLNGEVKEDRVIKAAKLANAYDFTKKFEEGFDTDVGELGSKLSGGQRQRIAIARALIKNPDVLLLDEATCGLDACNEYDITQAINNFMKDRTSVVVAHNMETIKNADNIIVLEKGKIVGIGNHDSLYSKNALYRKYYDLSLA